MFSYVTVNVPNFQRLLQIIKILQKTNVTLNFTAFTMSDNIYNFDSEIQRCVGELLRTEDYNSALELSSVAELDSSEIILAQVLYQYKFLCGTNFQRVNLAFCFYFTLMRL